MEVKRLQYMLWTTNETNAVFIEEQERLHLTIPKTNVKQTKSNKKVCFLLLLSIRTKILLSFKF